MANNQRMFQDGLNNYQGFIVNVVRFTGAYNTSFNQEKGKWNRQCALHWGTITTPDGEVIDMGESGMSTPDIKKKIAQLSMGDVSYTARIYNRQGDSRIKDLESARAVLESNGLPTDSVDAQIQAIKDEIAAQRASAVSSKENQKRIKALNKKIKEIEKAKVTLIENGLPTFDADARINELHAEIMSLM